MNIDDQGILGQVKTPGPLTRALVSSGIAQMPIHDDQRVAFADGGSVANGGIVRQETADELMARMTAKYGAPSAGPAQQPAPQVQQPAQPKPAPAQPTGSGQGILGILRGRKEAIDKAAGFANGGKISGPGTPTSDSIPAKIRETGEGILVSNRERIVSADQEQALQNLARGQGFESLDSMLEQMTGKPVGPTIKSTARAAADGLSPETDPDADGRRQYSATMGDAFASRGGESFAPKGPSNGPESTALDPVSAVTQTEPASASLPASRSQSVQAHAGILAGLAPQGSMAVAKPEVRETSGEHAPSGNRASAGASALPAGRNEDGVITAESAKGILGEPMRRFGGLAGSIDMAGVNGIMARENQARGEMIDMSIRANGGNGIGILGDGGVSESNDEKTARWRQDELLQQAKYGNHGAAHALQAEIAGRNALATEGVRQRGEIQQRGILAGIEASRQAGMERRAVDRNQVQMRGQDLTAATAADRLDSQERIAEQRTQDAGTRLTLPQRRSNFEIAAARKAVAGLTPEEIKHKTANFTATGRENPDYDPSLAKAVSLAGRRMYGDDAEFDQRQQEQAQQPAGTDGDVMTRFRADAGMKGHTIGKQTDMGVEVLDASGKLIGHYR